MSKATLPVVADTPDSSRIRIGGGVRVLPTPPAGIADSGRIRNGGGVRRA